MYSNRKSAPYFAVGCILVAIGGLPSAKVQAALLRKKVVGERISEWKARIASEASNGRMYALRMLRRENFECLLRAVVGKDAVGGKIWELREQYRQQAVCGIVTNAIILHGRIFCNGEQPLRDFVEKMEAELRSPRSL